MAHSLSVNSLLMWVVIESRHADGLKKERDRYVRSWYIGAH